MILLIGYHMIVVSGFNVPNFHRYFVGASAIVIISLLILVNYLRWATSITHAIKLLCTRHKAQKTYKRRVAQKKMIKDRKIADLVSIETERDLMET